MTTPLQPNVFYNQALQAPASPLKGRDTRQGSAQLAKHAADNSTPFADNEAGHAAYQREITAFDQANGDIHFQRLTTPDTRNVQTGDKGMLQLRQILTAVTLGQRLC